MSLFGSIMNKIFHHGGGTEGTTSQHPAPSSTDAAPAPNPAAPAPGGAGQAATQAQAPVAAAPAEPVDVEAVLEEMARVKGGGGNWRTSIVDLLKLLDLDSSLSARKDLANELNVHAGADGSAEENIALSKAVWAKLAENGGVIPDSLRS